jgi:PAS domain S-box-containing protein
VLRQRQLVDEVEHARERLRGHRRMEESLRESERRFHVMADTAPVLIWMSGPDGRCTYFNQPWLDFTGRPLTVELGDGWIDSVHPDDRVPAVDGYRRAFAAREPFRLEYRLRRHDGVYRWILAAGVGRATPDGTFAGYIGSAVDVTDHKIARKALSNLSQKLMEAQEHERTRIARELHDDIGQRVALLTIDLDRLAHALPSDVADARGRIADLGRRAGDLEKDVQAMSHRLHSSKLELLGIALAMAGFCHELAEQQRVVIDFTSEAIPEHLSADVSLALFRVLQEALTNAVKHAGAPRFGVRLRGSRDAIELEVSDAGVGFDPQAAMSGHGLGLVSMTERLHLVGGELHIDSRPGAGTRVRARVPLDPRERSGVDRLDGTARRAG